MTYDGRNALEWRIVPLSSAEATAFATRRVRRSRLGAIDMYSADSDPLVNLDQRAVTVALFLYCHSIIHPTW